MAFNIDYSVCVIVMAVLTGVYVIAGGYMATAINDFIQGIIMIVGIVRRDRRRCSTARGALWPPWRAWPRSSDPAVSDIPGVFASFFGPDPLDLLGVVLLTSLGTWGLPQMVQKFYAIRSEKAIDTGTVISTRLRPGGGGRLLLPGRLRPALLRPESTWRPTDMTPSSPPCSPDCPTC